MLGYGTGLSAALTKLVVEECELSAPRAWAWLVKQYLKTQRRRAVGRADAVETRLSWDYLRGGFLGSRRWRAALRTQRAAAALQTPAVSAGPPSPRPRDRAGPAAGSTPVEKGAEPAVSVVVPTYRRPQALRRCLEALAGQDAGGGSFEVVVVDDDPEGGAAATAGASWPFGVRHVCSGGSGAAAARNCGAAAAAAPLLLFLDDDVVADPWLVGRHIASQARRQEPSVLVGPYRPCPTGDNLAATAARLWWQDLFDLLDGSRGTTFVAALTANMSVPRSIFERVGGFSEDYSRQRREDWEWGLRVRRAGVPIGFDPEASARHEFTLGTAQRLRDARREGFGDTLIAAGYPEALASLPLPSLRVPTPAPAAALGSASASGGSRPSSGSRSPSSTCSKPAASAKPGSGSSSMPKPRPTRPASGRAAGGRATSTRSIQRRHCRWSSPPRSRCRRRRWRRSRCG